MSSRAAYTASIAAQFPLAPAPADDNRRAAVKSGELYMLWYDGDTRANLASKVIRACQFFRRKYVVEPKTVYVAPSMLLDGAPTVIDGVRVKPSVTVLPQHFFVSAEESHD